MHQVIRAIVYAEDEKGALSKAEEVFGGLVKSGHFDYYALFTPEDSTRVSGIGRYGKVPPVSPSTSEDGKRLIEEGMRFTRESFMRNMETIRKRLVTYTDEQLFEENEKKGESPTKFYMYEAGMYRGPEVFVYDNDGEGIRTTSHLTEVLQRWNDMKYDSLSVWVVPADVHF